MKALIIVESMFGNTRKIADRIAARLRSQATVDVCDIADVPAEVAGDVDLLLLGGPTHALGLSRSSTRADAVNRGATHPAGAGLRDWLEQRPRLPKDAWVAAFDTRINKPRVPGSAARAAARRLHRLDARLLIAPKSFYVDDVDGPLRSGQLERADSWADEIVAAAGRRGLLADQASHERSLPGSS